MNIKEKIKQNKWNIIITLIYAIVTFIITVFFHEKWRDEAQAWLIAKDLDIIGIIKQMSFEGHPPLWHLILMPFAKLGFPYITESIISWGIMVITVWIFLIKSPFKKETKILILLTAPFIYLYPSIARNYCLIPLALALIAMYYPKRKEKMLGYCLSVLLLAYTHVLMLSMVGILYLFYFIDEIFYTKKTKADKKRLTIAIAISAIGLICLIFILMGSTTKNTEIPLNNDNTVFSINKVKLLTNSIFGQLFGVVSNSKGFEIYFYIWLILLVLFQARKNLENLVIAFVTISWQIFIYLFIYGASYQKTSILLLIAVFIAWINSYNEKSIEENKFFVNINKIVKLGCLVALVLNAMLGVTEINYDIKDNYSNAKDIAQYINKNIEKDSIFICINTSTASAVIPYTHGQKYWNPVSEEFFTYITWNKSSLTNLGLDEIIEKVQKNFNKSNKLYLIESDRLNNNQTESIKNFQQKNILSEKLYDTDDDCVVKGESYTIYKINLQEN